MHATFASLLLAIGASALVVPPNSRAVSTTCPKDIIGVRFEFPHLIIPTSAREPDKAFGTAYVATISPGVNTLYSYDIPNDFTGTCSLGKYNISCSINSKLTPHSLPFPLWL
jgi:hypothetical protein